MGPAVEVERLTALIDAHAAALVLYARQWCAVPEDVVQEAFLKLASQGTAPREPAAWLYRVVRNGAISAARSDRRRQHHEATRAAQAPGWFAPAEAGPIDAETAATALERLPIEQREAIVAHLWGGLTFEQIGIVSGVSAATAYRRYVAGLQSLRERLDVPCPNTRSTTP